ncbi:DUF6647 family protein [Halomonas sp. C05BenzN]|uniref:DUF6647 family protein n=1 Tax=Halomonas sp. C05BenzN TaxID=3411041 RepID=UPI003B92FBD1
MKNSILSGRLDFEYAPRMKGIWYQEIGLSCRVCTVLSRRRRPTQVSKDSRPAYLKSVLDWIVQITLVSITSAGVSVLAQPNSASAFGDSVSMAESCLPQGLLVAPSTLPISQESWPTVHERVKVMIAWVVARTDYTASPPPTIALESQLSLKARCFPGFNMQHLPDVMGVYDPGNGTIYLDFAFDSGSVLDVSYLLHEVVHHMQVQSGAHLRASCREVLEGEATRLQLEWLREHGVADPYETLGIDQKTLRIIEMCPR